MRDDAVLGRALPLDRGLGPRLTRTIVSKMTYNVSSGTLNHTIVDVKPYYSRV